MDKVRRLLEFPKAKRRRKARHDDVAGDTEITGYLARLEVRVGRKLGEDVETLDNGTRRVQGKWRHILRLVSLE